MSPFSLFPCRPLYAASFALLTVLTLSSCVSVRPSGDTGLVPFTSDGCSLFPDGTFEIREK
ncbi:MAG: hypothetical protein HGB35_09045, partial [Geobacteraceae bacterium]|nr:hypothetical protein [Geobacteraceae bacterium]